MGICWVDDFKGGHFNMFIMRVAQLNKQGLCIMGNLWNPKIKAFCSWKEIKGNHGLEKGMRRSFGKGS